MEIVLNELSFPKVDTQKEAKELFDHFFEFCVVLHKLSLNKTTSITRVHFPDFNHRELTTGFNFYSWLKTIPVHRQFERSLFLKMLAENKKAINYPEITYSEEVCTGLAYASVNNLIAISFLSHNDWNADQITVKHLSMNNDTFKEEDILIKHCSKKEHIIKLKIWEEANFQNDNPETIKDNDGVFDKTKFQKFLFPNIKASNELVNNVEIRPNINTKDWDDFYKQLVNLSPEERISIYLEIANNIATINGWMIDNNISQKNNRKVYKAGNGRRIKYLGIDTQHGAFEFHLRDGDGEAEFKFNGKFQKNNKHKIDIP